VLTVNINIDYKWLFTTLTLLTPHTAYTAQPILHGLHQTLLCLLKRLALQFSYS